MNQTEKKITNEEIVQSLELIATTRNCNECKIRNCKWGTCDCPQITAKTALDFINRQKAEIKRLQKEANLISIQFQDLQERTNDIKSEAYKEFAEKLKKEWFCNGYDSPDVDFDDFIDNLLKEMVGEDE